MRYLSRDSRVYIMSYTFNHWSTALYYVCYTLTTSDLRSRPSVYSPLIQTGGRASRVMEVEWLSWGDFPVKAVFWMFKQGGTEDSLKSSLAKNQLTPPSATQKSTVFTSNQHSRAHLLDHLLSIEVKRTSVHFDSHTVQACLHWDWKYLEWRWLSWDGSQPSYPAPYPCGECLLSLGWT